MNLYDINSQILSLVDEETGEIADFDRFQELALAREEKIENTALFIKNLTAEANAIKAEEKNLADRRKAVEGKVESLERYLDTFLAGDTFKSAKVSLTYRKSTATVLDDGFVEWAKANGKDYLKFTEPTADKTAIKKALASGEVIEHASLEERYNLQIK